MISELPEAKIGLQIWLKSTFLIALLPNSRLSIRGLGLIDLHGNIILNAVLLMLLGKWTPLISSPRICGREGSSSQFRSIESCNGGQEISRILPRWVTERGVLPLLNRFHYGDLKFTHLEVTFRCSVHLNC